MSAALGPRDGDFLYEGRRLTYSEWGEGERVLVMVHGLLMNRRMYDKLAPEMASRGYRVVTLDLLGHGRSDRPDDMRLYNMPTFGRQIAALVDHLELEEPVVGGTSLGANATLEFAVANPGRARAYVIEMPVLDNGLLGAALAFTPALLGLRFGRPVLRVAAALTSRIPRSNYLVDVGLDWVRQDPAPSSAVLEGVIFGRTAPGSNERTQIEEPALVIGHHGEPLHPFSDAGMLVEEMPAAQLLAANSLIEWRIRPERLDDELDAYLQAAYTASPSNRPA